MSAQATASQRDDGVIAAITAPTPANENWRKMSQDALREHGYVIGFGKEGEDEYRADPCKHISLNQSIAKELVMECPDFAMRQHPRLGGQKRKATPAMEAGSLMDELLTGTLDFSQADKPGIWRHYLKTKKVTVEVSYNDWNGYRVIDAKDFTEGAAKSCRDDARARGLKAITLGALVKQTHESKELAVRLELAGVNLRDGKQQVPVYWVEFADDGTPVQCRGKLDQVIVNKVRDLKKTERLTDQAIARKIWDYGYDIQAVAYLRACDQVTGEQYDWEWAWVAGGDLPAARVTPMDETWAHCGLIRWKRAVNLWAKCLREGFWPGYELERRAPVAEGWMLAAAERFEMEREVSNGEG